MSTTYAKTLGLSTALTDFVRKVTPTMPDTTITLGSGLANILEKSEYFNFIGEIWEDKIVRLINAHSLPEFTANGHILRIIVVEEKITKRKVLAICGRKHMYEIKFGERIDKVVRLPRALALAGVRNFIHTSAVGGISPSKPGSLILVKDHDGLENIPMHLFSGVGGDEEFGPIFFDCQKLYQYHRPFWSILKPGSIFWKTTKGVLQWHLGPNFESPAQIKRLRQSGIGGVGMSMLPEVLALHQMKLHSSGEFSNIKNIGIGVVANPAAGIGGVITHTDVKTTMEKVGIKLLGVISEIIKGF